MTGMLMYCLARDHPHLLNTHGTSWEIHLYLLCQIDV
jgi:hypothetical protein